MSRVGNFHRPRCTCGRKKVCPASYRRPLMVRRTITPKISSQDVLDDKFARMSLKPSQREAMRILGNSKKHKRVSTKHCKRIPPNSSKDALDDKFANMRLTTSQSVPESRVLYEVYKASKFLYGRIKDAVELMRHLESHKDDERAKSKLQLAELDIDTFSLFYESLLPSGWKYDPTTIGTLFA